MKIEKIEEVSLAIISLSCQFPCGIAIDTTCTTDIVNVMRNYKVTMFTTDSNFFKEFGIPGREVREFNTVYGLAVDERTGDLYFL